MITARLQGTRRRARAVGASGLRRLPSSPLTARGWSLTAATVVIVAAGAIFGILELYAVGAAAAVLLLGALIWTRAGRWQIVADRQLHNLRAGVGEDVVVSLRLVNQSRYRSPPLRLRDPVQLGSGAVDLAIGSLPPGGWARGSYRLRARTRGVFQLGPLSMYASDPFGLAQRLRVSPATSTVIVHPKVEDLQLSTGAGGVDRRSLGRLPAPGRDNDEFATLREYRPGDDLRRLHWASTARADTLMVREDQIQHQGQLTVLVDLQATTWTPRALERGLSAAASVALASLAAGLSVRLVTTAGIDSGAASGSAHGARILDELAAAEAHTEAAFASREATGSRASADVVRGDGHHGPRYAVLQGGAGVTHRDAADSTDTLVVIGGEGTAAALRARSGIARNASLVNVVIEGAQGHPEGSSRASGRVVRVGKGGLAAAWNQAAR